MECKRKTHPHGDLLYRRSPCGCVFVLIGIQSLILYNAPLLEDMVHLFIVETVIYFLHDLPQTTAF